MRIKDTSVFVGPNLYALFRVIRMTVDLGPLEEWPSGRLGESFTTPLVEALPGLKQHGCSYSEAGGFIRRLVEEEGTWLGHVFEHPDAVRVARGFLQVVEQERGFIHLGFRLGL